MSDDGWVDYGEQVKSARESLEQERHVDKFDPRLARNPDVSFAQKRSKSPNKTEFVLPSQVKSMNNKIRHLFHKQNGEYDATEATVKALRA